MDLGNGAPLQQSICRLIAENRFHDDDQIVILAGSFGPAQGATFIEISSAANFKLKCH
jgi:pyruvate kinase